MIRIQNIGIFAENKQLKRNLLDALFDYTANEQQIKASGMETWVRGACGGVDIDLVMIPPVTKAYWLEHQLNVLDTPSERDFEGQVDGNQELMV